VSATPSVRLAVAVACGLWAAACLDDPPIGPGRAPPTVAGMVVARNPESALSAVVTFGSAVADSARVLSWSSFDSAATPYYPIAGGVGRIVLLGLRPNAEYRCIVEAMGPGGRGRSEAAAFRTDSLPGSLRGVHLELTGVPSPGYLLTAVTQDSDAFAVAFDSSGSIRWYRRFAARPGETAIGSAQQADGDFSVFVGASTGWEPVNGRYFAFTPGGEIVGSYTAGPPYYTDPHEIVLGDAGTAAEQVLVFGYDLRRIDLTSLGGRADQLVAGHTVLRQSPSGTVDFLWSAWDNFSVQDWVVIPPNLSQLASIDFDHPNSLEIDRDGNYIVSFASLTEVTKIDAVTGRVMWRLGGHHNQFAINRDALNGFGIQHDVRLLDDGDLILYDNGTLHNPPQSRAVEYRVDTRSMTATLVWEYRHSPAVFTPFVGSVQRYRNGNTLVGFGAAGLVTEVTPAGDVVWEGRLTVPGRPLTLFYRMRKVSSLYRYERQ
jgi:hypothetical protein